jgi:hypothetical protein
MNEGSGLHSRFRAPKNTQNVKKGSGPQRAFRASRSVQSFKEDSLFQEKLRASECTFLWVYDYGFLRASEV